MLVSQIATARQRAFTFEELCSALWRRDKRSFVALTAGDRPFLACSLRHSKPGPGTDEGWGAIQFGADYEGGAPSTAPAGTQGPAYRRRQGEGPERGRLCLVSGGAGVWKQPGCALMNRRLTWAATVLL
jgi:hypothetical protein